MTMNVDDCINFANQNPSSYIATTDGDQPRVRGMLMWFADKTGFYYNTGATKDLYRQLQANPKGNFASLMQKARAWIKCACPDRLNSSVT